MFTVFTSVLPDWRFHISTAPRFRLSPWDSNANKKHHFVSVFSVSPRGSSRHFPSPKRLSWTFWWFSTEALCGNQSCQIMVEDYSIIKHCKRLDQVENGKVLSSIVGHLGISIFYTYSLTPHIKSVDCPIEFSKFRPGQTRVDRNDKQVFKTTFRFSCDLPSSFHCLCHIHSPPP